MDKKVLDEWLKVNVALHNKLEELKDLDKERNSLIEEASSKGMNEDLTRRMNDSLNKYEKLYKEMEVVRLKSEKIRKIIEENK